MKKISEWPNDDDDDERDEDPKFEAEPSLDSLGRPVSGSRRTHGANIGLVQVIINIAYTVQGDTYGGSSGRFC